jgi:signal transduction histidine kinase
MDVEREGHATRVDPGTSQVAFPGPLVPSREDAALAVALTVLILFESSTHDGGLSPAVVLMTLPLAWRRLQPLLVFGLITMGAVVASAAPYVGLAAVMIAAYSVGAYARHRLVSLGVLVATATAIVAIYGSHAMPDVPAVLGPYLLIVPLWVAGQAISTRQMRADAFEDRATRLEREQEAATQAAIAEERGRIARELHDVVAHSVSVMLVQAGAARHILGTAPDQARESLLAVEASGREAMADLRHLLGVLHDDGEGMTLAPQPGAEQIESLVRRVGEAGLPVALRIEGQPRPLPPGINLTVYRIVQEALTNALKHAGLARTEVILDYRAAELKIEVLDEGNDPCDNGRHGHGLVGMQERVALYGGTLEAGPRLERGYAVRAWLPLGGVGT